MLKIKNLKEIYFDIKDPWSKILLAFSMAYVISVASTAL